MLFSPLYMIFTTYKTMDIIIPLILSQMSYLLIVILELNNILEIQYKEIMIIDYN